MYDEQELISQNYMRGVPLSNAYKQEKPLTFVKVFFDQIHLSIAIFLHWGLDIKKRVVCV
jgi:hypothetical protein